MVAVEGKHRHEEIAQGYTLQHCPDAQVAETERVAPDGIVEPVDKESDGEEQHRSLHYFEEYGARSRKLRLRQRQVARDAHDEQEEGEDEVARRHAVPLHMLQHLKRFTIAVIH